MTTETTYLIQVREPNGEWHNTPPPIQPDNIDSARYMIARQKEVFVGMEFRIVKRTVVEEVVT